MYLLDETKNTFFSPQIFQFLYEIFYSVEGSNILQQDIMLTSIIKCKLNEIKVQKKKLKLTVYIVS